MLYFLSSTINPILYNLLSRKFRQASKRTLCRCCVNVDSIPAFYKLKAKFICRGEISTSSQNERRYLDPEIRLAKLTGSELRNINKTPGYPSTKDTSMRQFSPATSSSSAHAHSDGRLEYLCRHKYCSGRRARLQALQESSNLKHLSDPDIDNYSMSRYYRQCLLLNSAIDGVSVNRDRYKDMCRL